MLCTVTLNTAVDKVLSVKKLQPGRHMKADIISISPAGKGINVARGSAKMELNAVCCGFVGKNQYQLFNSSLKADGLSCSLTPCSQDTRTNTSIRDISTNLTTHIREPGFNISPHEFRAFRNDLIKVLNEKKFHAIAICGSLPGGITNAQLSDLISETSPYVNKIILDINTENPLEILHNGLVDTIKPNLPELQGILGETLNAEQAPFAARELLSHVNTVLLTVGEKGAFLINNQGIWKASCSGAAAEVRNTVGCGDAFLAGMLAAGQKGYDFAKSLKYAVAAATASACSTETAGYDSESIEKWMGKTSVIKLGAWPKRQ